MRFRITVRGEGVELRGYLDADGEALGKFAHKMEPYGVVLASIAADDYNPFFEEQQRELHHFETEQENARIRNILSGICASYGHTWKRKMHGRFCERCETFESD